MPRFRFEGTIPGSKSELIRAHLVETFVPELTVQASALAEDVVAARAAKEAFLRGEDRLDANSSGLLFRLLLARASRLQRPILITGKPRLLERPHTPLLEALTELGVGWETRTGGITVEGPWRAPPLPVPIDVARSSQYLSALLLASFGLPFALELRFLGTAVSGGYRDLTLEFMRQLGVEVERREAGLRVPAGQVPAPKALAIEPDLSTAFAVAALAAVAGEAVLHGIPEHSRQPDALGLRLLAEMGVRVEREGTTVRVQRAEKLQPITVDLSGAPDLFPVLSMLAALADGTSRLYGAPHLALKESNRLVKAAELIQRIGRGAQPIPGGLLIQGRPPGAHEVSGFSFDPDQDHRQVMAAYVARAAGIDVRIEDVEAVHKSAPELLDWIRDGLSA
ncbi:MAG: hypothetical protein U1E65_17605 [Myxococcota bacterium]